MTEKNILYKLLTFLTSLGLAVSGWFLTKTYDRLDALDNAVMELRLIDEKNGNSKFSTSDWYIAKTLIDADRNAMDKRIIKLEEAIPVIKESLLEIKQTLKDGKM